MLVDHTLSMLWAATWQSLILAVAVWTIVRLSRDTLQPRWRYALWCIVFIRLAMPIIPSTPWGVLSGTTLTTHADPGETLNVGNTSLVSNAADPHGTSVTVESVVVETDPQPYRDPESLNGTESRLPVQPVGYDEPSRTMAVSPTAEPHDGPPDAIGMVATSPPSANQEPFAEREAAAVAMPDWQERIRFPLASLWLAGVFVALTYHLLGEMRIVRMRKGWEPVEDESVREMFALCCRRLGISDRAAKRIRLFAVDGKFGAGSLGAGRPTIVISKDALDRLSGEQLEFVLLHELTHHRRFDPLVNHLTQLLAIVHWFNPVAWFSLNQLSLHRETACDAAVLDQIASKQKSSYGYTILDFASAQASSHELPGLVWIAEKTGLRRRIEMITRHEPTRWRHLLSGIGVVLFVAMFGLTRAETSDQPSPLKTAEQQNTTEAERPSAQEEDVAVDSSESAEPDATPFTLTFVGPDDEPIAGSKVRFCVDPVLEGGEPMPGKGWWEAYHMRATDSNGKITVDIPDISQLKTFETCPRIPGYALQYLRWDKDNLPGEYTVKLDAAGESLGGLVVDPDGHPVNDAAVGFSLPISRERSSNASFDTCAFRGYTDENGCWSCEYIPVDSLKKTAHVSLSVSHPDWGTTRNSEIDVTKLRRNSSGEFDYEVCMVPPLSVSGRVTNPDGLPVADAEIAVLYNFHKVEKQKTDADGRFSCVFSGPAITPAGMPGFVLAATHDDCGPGVLTLSPKDDCDNVAVRLCEKGTLKLKIVDENDEPIEGAYATLESWNGNRRFSRGIWSESKSLKSDSDGMMVWENAPSQGEIELDLRSKNHKSQEPVVIAGDEVQVITMEKPFLLEASVIDDETGEPIEQFTVFRDYTSVNQRNPALAEWRKVKAGENGRFQVKETWSGIGYNLYKIEAEGYEPATSEFFDSKSKGAEPTFRLQSIASKPRFVSQLTGIVLTPGGEPASGAQIAYAEVETGRHISFTGNSGLTMYIAYKPKEPSGSMRANEEDNLSDEEGRFTLPKLNPIGKHLVAINHREGGTVVSYKEFPKLWDVEGNRNLVGETDGPTIQLQPWSRIEGVAMEGEKPLANANIRVRGEQIDWSIAVDPADREHQYERLAYVGSPSGYKTDGKGRFDIERLPPGTYKIYIDSRDGSRSRHRQSHSQTITLDPGETTHVRIGGSGTTVTGRLLLPDNGSSMDEVDWQQSFVEMYRTVERPKSSDMPKMPQALQARLKEMAEAEQEESDAQEEETPATFADEKKPKVVRRPSRVYRLDDFLANKEIRRMAEESDEIRQYLQAIEESQKKNAEHNGSFHSPWVGHLSNDGTFRIPDVPPGDWTFIAFLWGKADQEGGRGAELAQLGFRMAVPSPPQGSSTGTLHLGALRMTPSYDELQRQGVVMDVDLMGRLPTGEAFQLNSFGAYIQLEVPRTVEESQEDTGSATPE